MTAGRVEVLSGGVANAGAVVRIDGRVRRPTGPHSGAVHALLDHLEARRFDGAPRLLAAEPGFEYLEYIEGQVALPPLPAWSRTESAACSVAALLRRYHDAVADFDVRGATGWDSHVPEPHSSGALAGHNDTVRSNVVFRDGHAVALIDFDRAAPSTVEFELAVAVGQWIPLRGEEDDDDRRSAVRTARRIRDFLDAYGAPSGCREPVLDLLLANERRNEADILALARSGDARYAGLLEGGALSRTRDRIDWMTRHAQVLGEGMS